MRLIYWGTPEFAVPSLRALLGEGHEVVAVVTQPDRPAGRGRGLRSPPVKRLAEEETIPVLQPEKPVGDTFLARLREYAPDLSVVVAYGRILRREVLDVPAGGSINLHASLLPELRGAAPIQWAIARGHEFTGVTVMRMVERMDAGPILMQVAEPIGEEERASDLTARLSEIGAEILVETLALLEVDGVAQVEQDESRATFAPLITRDDAHVDWSRPAVDVCRQIRAFDAVPGAWSVLDGSEIKLFRPLPIDAGTNREAPGTVLRVEPTDAAEGMLIACGAGALWIREVQPAGRSRMPTAAWLRGRGAEVGQQLT
ncbi:MAG: methionyl-tRNA formyltransferase [Longimicrobiales bacterium]